MMLLKPEQTDLCFYSRLLLALLTSDWSAKVWMDGNQGCQTLLLEDHLHLYANCYVFILFSVRFLLSMQLTYII